MVFVLTVLLLVPSLQRPTDIVRWSATAKPVQVGTVAKIELTAKIEDGWKLYALTQPKGGPVALEISVDKEAPFKLDQKQITAPLPKVLKDDNFNLDTQYYEREAAFTVPIGIPKAAAGKQIVPLDITFQACGASICLRPYTHRVTVEIDVKK